MNNKIINDKFISSLESVVLNLKPSLRGFFSGNHKTNINGSSVEFSDFREYNLGDDIRKIDWNLYSRFEKYFIKLFVDERQMLNTIYLDTSASMGSGVLSDKNQACLQVAAALGFVSVQNLDKLCYKLINEDQLEDLCGKVIGKDAFYRSIQQLEDVPFKGSSSISKAITSDMHIEKSDGASVLISDFLFDDDFKKGIEYLLYNNKDVMVIQVLSVEELAPTITGRYQLFDCESSDSQSDKHMKMKISKREYEAYKMALDEYLSDIKRFCAARGVGYALIRTDKPVVTQLFGSLYESLVAK